MNVTDTQQTKQRSRKYTSKQEQQSKESVSTENLDNKANRESRSRPPGDRRHNPMMSAEEAKDKLAHDDASKAIAKQDCDCRDKNER